MPDTRANAPANLIGFFKITRWNTYGTTKRPCEEVEAYS